MAPVSTPTLGDLLESIAGGATPRRSDDSLYTDRGVKFLRILNIGDGEIVERDLKHITDDVHQGALERSQLVAGDVLMTITGRVGCAAIVREEILPANINQHIARLRIDASRCRPEFLSEWLNCSAGLELSNRFTSGGTRDALDYDAIRKIRIPLPDSLEKQDSLLNIMNQARADRKTKLDRTDALLAGVDDFLSNALGIKQRAEDSRRSFGVRLAQPRAQGRLNPDYYHPERVSVLRALNMASANLTTMRLSNVADSARDQISTPGDNYLGLAHVQSNTGELANVEDTASGSCLVFQTDDVLFSRLRPYLNKVYRAEMDGCCSTEFHVLRVKDHAGVLPEYLAAILRSYLVLAQTRHMMTGNTHPRLTNDDVYNLTIPIPTLDIQKTIVAEIHLRRQDARRLRADAEDGWQAAKRWFEEQLLGKDDR